jgi:serine/threonine protein phosphatase PrpC
VRFILWLYHVELRLFPCYGRHCTFWLDSYYFSNEPALSHSKLLCRSLGDAVAHTAGVISDPEFTERELDPEADKFVIVATDGLWEFIENDETIELALEADSPSDSVDLLVKEANARWMREEQVIDDTTIIAAHLFGYKTS